MRKTNKIDAFITAKLLAILMSLIGLLAGLLYSIGGAFYDISTDSISTGTALAFLSLIGMPIIFASAGFILGYIGSILFNISSRWIGGIDIDIGQSS